jgi:hypothetical protein
MVVPSNGVASASRSQAWHSNDSALMYQGVRD